MPPLEGLRIPTSYEIYQTYLRGPTAVIRLFEQSPLPEKE
jgi:hypothetical protein